MFRLKSTFIIKTLYRNTFAYFKKIHVGTCMYTEMKHCLHSLSFEDSRLQKHIKYIQEQYMSSKFEKSHLYSYDSIKSINILMEHIEKLKNESNELDVFITELKGKDDELQTAAQVEKEELESQIQVLKFNVINHLAPVEITDDKDIIMELTYGVGGQEAMLFAQDMFDMYCRFACWKGWTFEILKHDKTDLGGLKHGHVAISGKNAYKFLKYECGVHRVQRVPKTEKTGRIHTSTMTVAVLPQPSAIDIVIQPKDIELEFKRSRGAGGQHVNTTDSCVRIYHKPTGIVVECQMERCQHKNRELAMKSLRAKLYERELERITKATNTNRKLQIGTAARSEKVRTYNFVQDRITDHRAHINLYSIEEYFRGEQMLDKMLENLQEWNSSQMLMEMLRKYDTS